MRQRPNENSYDGNDVGKPQDHEAVDLEEGNNKLTT